MSSAENSRSDAFKWYAVLIIGVIAASASATIIKIAQTDNVPPLVIAAVRNFVACFVLAPFLLRGPWREIAGLSGREKLLIVASGLILAFHFAMWVMSLEKTNVASATVFITTTPIFVVLGSAIFLKEKASPLIFIGIFVSIAGGAMVAWADLDLTRIIGLRMALYGAAAASAYMLIGRRIRPKLHLVPYIFAVYGIAGISLAITALAKGDAFLGHTPKAYAMMVLLGLVSSLIGHTSINYVLRHLKSYVVSVAMLGEPVSATVLALIFIGMREMPSWFEVAGCIVMLLGIYLSIRFSNRSARD